MRATLIILCIGVCQLCVFSESILAQTNLAESDKPLINSEKARLDSTLMYIYTNGNCSEQTKKTVQYDKNANRTIHKVYLLGKDGWIGKEKYIYEYDSIGSITLSESYKWNKSKGSWIGIKKYQRFDNSSNCHSPNWGSVKYVWREKKNDWKRNVIETTTPSIALKNKHITLTTITEHEQEGEWVKYWKEVNKLVDFSRVVETANYKWNHFDSVWMKESKEEYHFREAKNAQYLSTSDTIKYKGTESNNWEPVAKRRLRIRENYHGKMIWNTSYVWNDSSKKWVGKTKDEEFYPYNYKFCWLIKYKWDEVWWRNITSVASKFNLEGNRIWTVFRGWESENGYSEDDLWSIFQRDSLEYNNKQKVTLLKSYELKNGSLIGREKTEYLYDKSDTTLIQQNHYAWNDSLNTWSEQAFQSYSYTYRNILSKRQERKLRRKTLTLSEVHIDMNQKQKTIYKATAQTYAIELYRWNSDLKEWSLNKKMVKYYAE